MKLRNLNRGLILGGALIIGTAVYVVKENSDFKKNVPDIEDTVKESLCALAESNAAEQEKLEGRWRNFVSTYMTDYTNENDYSYKKQDVLREINYNSKGGDGEITKAAAEVKNISVSKSGSNGANVEFEYSLYYEYTGESPIYMNFWGINFLADSFYGEPSVTNAAKSKVTFDGRASFYMLETSEGWKIAGMQDGFYDVHNDVLEEAPNEEENEDEEAAESGSSEEETDDIGEEAESVG
ncbi:MAG: hypothetical protein J5994_04650 [Ruminococcus sp.]|nr:hypothetical protein [Ruminococcus sp.]